MSQRLIRVRELLKRELGVIIDRDFEFQGSLVTVTEVDITPDLKQAFVYIGIIGGLHRPDDILAKLNTRRASVQSRLSKRVVLKRTPQLTFRGDSSSERGVKLVSLMDQLGLEHQQGGIADPDNDPEDFDPGMEDDCDADRDSRPDAPPSRRR